MSFNPKSRVIHVLIVDDEEPTRALLADVFRQHGMFVHSSISAEEALERDDLAAVNVAVVDVHLGGKLDGHFLVKELSTRYPDIATILISGVAKLDDLVSAFSEQVFSFVTKPFTSLREVVLLVERAAESKRMEQQNRDYARRLAEHNQALQKQVEQSAGDLRKYEKYLSHLFSVTSSLSLADSPDDLLRRVCSAVVEAGIADKAVILAADSRFVIQHVGTHSSGADSQLLLKALRDRIGSALRPFEFGRIEMRVGDAILIAPAQPLDQSHGKITILPLLRRDGGIQGFFSTVGEKDWSETPGPIVHMLSVLLYHASLQLEALALRSELRAKNAELERRIVDRTSELRASQENFSRLVNATSDIVYITDDSFRIVYLNEAFSVLLGYQRENCIGRSLENVLQDIASDDKSSELAIQRLLSREQAQDFVTMAMKTAHGPRTLEFNRSVIMQADQFKGTQGIVRDVTERERLMNQLLAAERLATTGRIAAGIAHEINNPLQALVTQVNTIRSKVELREPATENLDLVSDALEKIRQIVRGMLDLSRPTSRSESDVQINDIVKRTLALLAPELKQRGVVVETTLDNEAPAIKGNQSELQQAIMNLLMNAIEAMPNGGRITVMTLYNEHTVQVAVGDDGVGIDEGDLGLIFEPFYSRRASGQGTGLGLFITKSIVDMHQGKIEVETVKGEGAKFTVSLPIL